MLHSSSMCLIFLDSSSFCISSFWIRADSERDFSFSCLEMSLRTLFSRSSSRLLITFLSFFFFFLEASSSDSMLCPLCSPVIPQDTQIQMFSLVQ
ncbi:hypothetical protein GDO81_019261 [Engystomops pustulosus]|uniref:Secreted protein n=1 Tax=Engystomops pustulosus TaxID=76066 RepID=A0AAV6YKK3_ENGPU|nr:hypothetical protein GDO81_019261 [Engystomops pustulosus]